MSSTTTTWPCGRRPIGRKAPARFASRSPRSSPAWSCGRRAWANPRRTATASPADRNRRAANTAREPVRSTPRAATWARCGRNRHQHHRTEQLRLQGERRQRGRQPTAEQRQQPKRPAFLGGQQDPAQPVGVRPAGFHRRQSVRQVRHRERPAAFQHGPAAGAGTKTGRPAAGAARPKDQFGQPSGHCFGSHAHTLGRTRCGRSAVHSLSRSRPSHPPWSATASN